MEKQLTLNSSFGYVVPLSVSHFSKILNLSVEALIPSALK